VDGDPAQPGDTSPETADRDSSTVTIPWWVAVAITVGALALAGLHLAFRSLRIDGTTLVLLAVAVLPWAQPLIKSFKVLGVELNRMRIDYNRGVELNRQQIERLHRAVEQVSVQVEEIRHLAITGATSEQKARLERDIAHYRGYLTRIGFTVDSTDPPIRIAHSPPEMPDPELASQYDDGSIYVLAEYVDRPTVPLREYTHHVLGGQARLEAQPAQTLIESGIAFYLPCSFTNDSRFGRTGSSTGSASEGDWLFDLAQPAARPSRSASDLERYQAGGMDWGHRLWELRGLVRAAVADPAVVAAWFDDAIVHASAADQNAFITAVCGRLPAEYAEHAAHLLTGVSNGGDSGHS
jgi:hypothetical protein